MIRTDATSRLLFVLLAIICCGVLPFVIGEAGSPLLEKQDVEIPEQDSKELEKRRTMAQLADSVSRVESSLAELASIPPSDDWPDVVRLRYDAMMQNALEVKEKLPPLKEILARFEAGRVTEDDRDRFDTLYREVARLGIQLVARERDFQNAMKPLIEAREADCRRAQEQRRRAEEERRENEDLGVTWKAYERIHVGMSSFDVQIVIGWDVPGEEQSSAGSLKVIAWRDGFRAIVATFDRDSLVAKAQSGL